MFRLGTSSEDTITIEPEWNYKPDAKKLEKKHRLENGSLYRYKTGDYESISFSVKYFDSSDAAIVNSWWQSNANLVFFAFSDTQVSSVQLSNNGKPFNKYQEPYDNLMQGTIKLEGY